MNDLSNLYRALAASTSSAVEVATSPTPANLDSLRISLKRALESVDGVSSTAAKLRERAAAMRSRQPSSLSPQNTSGSGVVKLAKVPPPPASVVREALGYARLVGVRRQSGVVSLSTRGKSLYETTLREVREFDRITGTVRTIDGERKEVVRRLECMDGGRAVKRLDAPRSIKLVAPVTKFMRGDLRLIRGFCSTADLDRQGDIVEPSGMKASLPVPLLWQHDRTQPIGAVEKAEIRREGVWIEASLVSGVQRADEAAALIDAGAVDSFSIGFQGLKSEPLAGGGLRYTLWTLYEVSVVSVPANPNAKIRRSM